MRIFLDTANLEHIRHGVGLGVVTGVTTNPSLVSREGRVDYRKLVEGICAIVPGPVSTEVLGQDVKAMVAEAREIAKWADNVVVKIPASPEGVEATAVLAKENVNVNFTLCFIDTDIIEVVFLNVVDYLFYLINACSSFLKQSQAIDFIAGFGNSFLNF